MQQYFFARVYLFYENTRTEECEKFVLAARRFRTQGKKKKNIA